MTARAIASLLLIALLGCLSGVAAESGATEHVLAASAEQEVIATDLRIGGDDKQTRFVVDLSRKIDLAAFTLADPYRVVGKDVDDRKLHQRTQTDRGAPVVAEDQEPRPEGPELRQRKTVEDRSHRVLADPEVKVPPGRVVSGKVAGARTGEACFARRPEIRGPADEPWHAAGNRIQCLPRCVARRHAPAVGRERREVAAPAVRKLTPQQQKMKDCGAKWQAYKKEKNVKGQAEYRKFQRGCLKG